MLKNSSADVELDSREPIVDPARLIVDAHHHLWVRPGSRYLLDEFVQDISSGHAIAATVYVQCHAMYRTDGPPEMRSLGETEFANGMAAMSASGLYGTARVASAIVGHVDLLLGNSAEEILVKHIDAAQGRFRGVRNILIWDKDESLKFHNHPVSSKQSEDPRFREGVACLGRMGLSLDILALHPQLADIAALADACPHVTIVLNHIGIPVNIGRYKDDPEQAFSSWMRGVTELARRPNVLVKLGGLGLPWPDLGFDRKLEEPLSGPVAEAWRPYIETCIEAFGADRCMFESNFPVDGSSVSYRVVWNAFKRITQSASESEKDALFNLTARRTYLLDRAKSREAFS